MIDFHIGRHYQDRVSTSQHHLDCISNQNADMEFLSDRLRTEREAQKISQDELARRASCGQSIIGNLESGQQQNSKYIPLIAAALGVEPLWLQHGRGPKHRTNAPGNAEAGPELRRKRLVPVVGDVRGGADGYLDELLYPAGHGDGCVPSPVGDASAYAVRVRGESMFPRYRAGEFVILAPMLEAMPGDDVVAILHDGRKMLKVLGWIRGDEIQLLSINNGYAPITLHASEIQALHVVAGTAHRSSCVPC